MNQALQPYPVHTLNFWKAYFIQMRPYLLFVSGIAGASGIAMNDSPAVYGLKTTTALVIFFLGYGFGQALTDCFQTDTDKLSAPYRPLSKGIVSVRNVLIISLSGLLLSGLLFYRFNPLCFWLSLCAVFGLGTYSIVKKRVPLAGPFYNAWIVALLPLMGYVVNQPAETPRFPTHLIPYLAITFFSYTNFVLIGYLKDVQADRTTGYRTFAVIYGWNITLLAGDVLAVFTLSCYWLQPGKNVYEIIFGLAASLVILYGQLTAHSLKIKNEQTALIPILSTVRSFVLFHTAIAIHFQPQWWPAGILYYFAFAWALKKRPEKFQV